MEYYSFVEFANILNNDNIVIDKTDKIYYIKELYDSYTKHLMVCKYNIDNFKHLSLFKLTRHNYNLSEKYWYNWEYHSSFSPIWVMGP
jgi:hypothetical protein